MAGWDGWMASLTQWTWVWVNSRSSWWTGRPGVVQFMGSQRVRPDWVTELNWTLPIGFLGQRDFSLRSRKKSSRQLVLRALLGQRDFHWGPERKAPGNLFYMHKTFNGFSEAFACLLPHLILKQFSGYSFPSKERYEWAHFRGGGGSPTLLYSCISL